MFIQALGRLISEDFGQGLYSQDHSHCFGIQVGALVAPVLSQVIDHIFFHVRKGSGFCFDIKNLDIKIKSD
jgi:hypothetical protein